MSVYETTLLLVATAVLVLSILAGNHRGAAWVVAIVADLMLSTAYWRADLPYGDVVTALCDFTVCVMVYCLGRYRWELHLFLLYQFSMLVSVIDLGAMIWAPAWIDHDTYSSVLEVVNYIAFFMIGGVSSFAFSDRLDVAVFRPWRWLRPAVFPLFSEERRAKG